jgi:hypothetical protein
MDDADAKDSYRAIGLYVVRFSRLVMRMRLMMGMRLTIGRDPLELFELAIAGAMAQQIADSFFSMCRFDGKLDDDELGVANVLRDAVNEQITHRNRFAHGDWWIGFDPAAGAAPELVRVTPKVRKGDFADLTTHPPDKLDQRSRQVEELVDDITEFGMLALGIPVGLPATELNREYRVRDVFTVHPGKSGRHKQPATFTRDGPRADELERLGYRSPNR